METTTIMFCSHIMRILIDNTLVFNAIPIQMLSHCDLILFIVFICSSVASVERGGVSFQTSKEFGNRWFRKVTLTLYDTFPW